MVRMTLLVIATLLFVSGCASTGGQETKSGSAGGLSCQEVCAAANAGCNQAIKESVAEGTLTEETAKGGYAGCATALDNCLKDCG
jgi:hypothetical protein